MGSPDVGSRPPQRLCHILQLCLLLTAFCACVSAATFSPEVTLSSLSLSVGLLQPAFDPQTTSYSVFVPVSTASIDVTAYATAYEMAVSINGNPAAPTRAVPLNLVTPVTLTILVLSANGSMSSEYQITVTGSNASPAQAVCQLLSGSWCDNYELAQNPFSISVEYTTTRCTEATPVMVDSSGYTWYFTTGRGGRYEHPTASTGYFSFYYIGKSSYEVCLSSTQVPSSTTCSTIRSLTYGKKGSCPVQDPCTPLAAFSLKQIPAVQACYSAIPSSSVIRSKTVNQLRSLSKLYSFTDISKNTGPPFNIRVNIPWEIERIARQEYANDYEFHLDVNLQFNKLGDAHTHYYGPTVYRSSFLMFPFVMKFTRLADATISWSTVSEVVVGDNLYGILAGIGSLAPYVGKTVVLINGRTPEAWASSVLQTFGTYRDFWIRWNAFSEGLTDRLPGYGLTTGPRMAGSDPVIQFQFQDSTSVTIPWLVYMGPPSQNRFVFFSSIIGFTNGAEDAGERPAGLLKVMDDADQLLLTSSRSNVHLAMSSLGPGDSLFGLTGIHMTEDDVENHPYMNPTSGRMAENQTSQPSLQAAPTRTSTVAAAVTTTTTTTTTTTPSFSSSANAVSEQVRPDDLIRMFIMLPKELQEKVNSLKELLAVFRQYTESQKGEPMITAPNDLQVHAVSITKDVFCGTSTSAPSTLFLSVMTFSPSDGVSPALEILTDFLQTVENCRKYAAQQNLANLVVDVRNNGGGYVCLNFYLASLIMRDAWGTDISSPSTFTQLAATYDLRRSDITDSLGSVLTNTDTRLSPSDPLSSANWYSSVDWTRGGSTSSYSAKGYFPTGCFSDFSASVIWKNVPGIIANSVSWAPAKILLLTDGRCGSACAQFSSILRYNGKALLLSKGGNPVNGTVDTASFTGGNVLAWNTFADFTIQSSPATASMFSIGRLPTTALMRYNFNEMYAGNTLIPRELSPIPPDYTTLTFDWENDTIVYNAVQRAQLLNAGAFPFPGAYLASFQTLNDPYWSAKFAALGPRFPPISFADQSTTAKMTTCTQLSGIWCDDSGAQISYQAQCSQNPPTTNASSTSSPSSSHTIIWDSSVYFRVLSRSTTSYGVVKSISPTNVAFCLLRGEYPTPACTSTPIQVLSAGSCSKPPGPAVDLSLSVLSLTTGTLVPSFEQEVTEYAVFVSQTTTSITVFALAVSGSAIVTVNGGQVSGSPPSVAVPLPPTLSVIRILVQVMSPDKLTQKQYTIMVTKTADTAASLNCKALVNSWCLTNIATQTSSTVTFSTARCSEPIPVLQTNTGIQFSFTSTNGGTYMIPSSGKTGTFSLPVAVGLNAFEICLDSSSCTPTTMTYGATGSCPLTDPCVLNQGSMLLSTLTTCFAAIPSSSVLRRDTVSRLRALSQLYSFTDINRQTGAPFYISVNLPMETERIALTTYDADFFFHNDVNKVFNLIGDAHTHYWGPRPYRTFGVVFPFSMSFASSGSLLAGPVTWTVASEVFFAGGYYGTNAGIGRLTAYVGKTVLSIDGKNPEAWAEKILVGFGSYRDIFIRWNAFSQALTEDFPLFPLLTGPSAPASPTVEFKFTDGTGVAIPWLVSATQSFSSRYQFFSSILSGMSISQKQGGMLQVLKEAQDHDAKQSAAGIRFALSSIRNSADPNSTPPTGKLGGRTTESSVLSQLLRPDRLLKMFLQLPADVQREVNSLQDLLSSFALHSDTRAVDQTLMTSAGLSVYKSSLTKDVFCATSPAAPSTLFLSVLTFAPSSTSYSDTVIVTNFLQTVEDCRKYAVQQGITKLVIDVRNNGGGYTCLGFYLANLIMRDSWGTDVSSPNTYSKYVPVFDLRRSAITDYLSSDIISSESRFDPSNPTSVSNWYTSVYWTRGNVSSTYSAKGYWPDACFSNLLSNQLWKYIPGIISGSVSWAPSKIVMLTDGRCGSACAHFTTILRYNGKALILSKGGNPQTGTVDTASFAGGNVLEWNEFASTVLSINPAVKSMFGIDVMPSTALMRFNFNEMYAGNQFTPRELSAISPDFIMTTFDWRNDSVVYIDDVRQSMVAAGFVPYSAAYARSFASFSDPAWDTLLQPMGPAFPPVSFTDQSSAVKSKTCVQLSGAWCIAPSKTVFFNSSACIATPPVTNYSAAISDGSLVWDSPSYFRMSTEITTTYNVIKSSSLSGNSTNVVEFCESSTVYPDPACATVATQFMTSGSCNPLAPQTSIQLAVAMSGKYCAGQNGAVSVVSTGQRINITGMMNLKPVSFMGSLNIQYCSSDVSNPVTPNFCMAVARDDFGKSFSVRLTFNGNYLSVFSFVSSDSATGAVLASAISGQCISDSSVLIDVSQPSTLVNQQTGIVVEMPSNFLPPQFSSVSVVVLSQPTRSVAATITLPGGQVLDLSATIGGISFTTSTAGASQTAFSKPVVLTLKLNFPASSSLASRGVCSPPSGSSLQVVKTDAGAISSYSPSGFAVDSTTCVASFGVNGFGSYAVAVGKPPSGGGGGSSGSGSNSTGIIVGVIRAVVVVSAVAVVGFIIYRKRKSDRATKFVSPTMQMTTLPVAKQAPSDPIALPFQQGPSSTARASAVPEATFRNQLATL
eukprot:ANDGO_07997.mRNA.1 hypothetical protein